MQIIFPLACTCQASSLVKSEISDRRQDLAGDFRLLQGFDYRKTEHAVPRTYARLHVKQ